MLDEERFTEALRTAAHPPTVPGEATASILRAVTRWRRWRRGLAGIGTLLVVGVAAVVLPRVVSEPTNTVPSGPVGPVAAQPSGDAAPTRDGGGKVEMPDCLEPGEVAIYSSCSGEEKTDLATNGTPADWIVNACRGQPASDDAPGTRPADNAAAEGVAEGTSALHCQAIIAIADGQLAPGTYSDEELREALGEPQ